MKEVILVRHGKACSLDAFEKDIDRVLIERGVNDGYKVANELTRRGIKPDIIITSPAARASHTAMIIARALKAGSDIISIADSLYHCSVDCITDFISALPDDISSVMFVAHNPGITDTAYELTRGATNFLPTTGIAVIQYTVSSWSEVPGSKSSNYFFIIPRELD